MTSQPHARHMAKADAQAHATSEVKHVEQKKSWLQRLKSLQGSKASRAAMLDQLHALSHSVRPQTPASTAPTPATPTVTGRSESAFSLYASARPPVAHAHYPSRPAPPSSVAQPARPAASFRSVSRLRGGVDPAAPAAMAAPLAKSRAEVAVISVDDSCDSTGRRLAHRRSASRHRNLPAAPAPSPAAPPATAPGTTRFPSTPHTRYPSNPKARHPTGAAATSRHPSTAAAHRISPAAHRMSPSARTSAFARSIAATAHGTNHLSPPASRRAARQ